MSGPNDCESLELWRLIDACCCCVCETTAEQLNAGSAALVHVWHSFGAIENCGFHGSLCEVGDEALEIARHYRSIGIESGALLIEQAAGLWRRYWPDGPADNSDPDDFRRRCNSELDEIEGDSYELENSIVEALLPIARRNTQSA